MDTNISGPTALLIVDVQYDFLPGGALAVPDGDAVLPAVRALLQREWAFVAASQDFHPPGHVSFASAHGKSLFSQLDVPNPFAAATADGAQPTTVRQMLWPDHCVQGTRGAEIEASVLAALQPWLDAGTGLIVQKGTHPEADAYSAFRAPPGADPAAGALAGALRARGVRTLVLAGLATDYCVDASARDARTAGFAVRVVREGVRAVDGGAEKEKEREEEWARAGVAIVGMDDV
ncbi:Isochorismatase hydrolase [Phellopilus nigrolimitatus]|nr:Isochorismatase hydrolase [Phellopilus nigrolimitatus]